MSQKSLRSFSPQYTRCVRLRAFTLVELLVVIAIIGVLVGLLLPAIQSARESARRAACQSNLRQVSLAVLNYESASKRFPAAFEYEDGFAPDDGSVGALNFCRKTWVISILPFFEQTDLYNSLDVKKPMSDPANSGGRSRQVGPLRCPSDANNNTLFNGSKAGITQTLGDGWGRLNYGCNASIGFCHANNSGAASAWLGQYSAAGPQLPYWTRFPGVMGGNTSRPLRKITDGTSKTVLLAEIRSGLTDADMRGVWALPMSSSGLWAHGGFPMGDAAGPNPLSPGSDDLATCREVTDAVGGETALIRLGMPCAHPTRATSSMNYQQAARSMHANGLFVSMTDGSVRWISDFIQTLPSTADNLSVWDKLMVSSDGQVVANDSL